jgi:hypothetical protein
MGCMSCLYISLYVKFEVLQKIRLLWVVHALRAVHAHYDKKTHVSSQYYIENFNVDNECR